MYEWFTEGFDTADLQEAKALLKSEGKVAKGIDERFIRVMGKVASAVKISSLLGEADERDLRLNAKKIRAALYFRQYMHWDTEVLHDEGTVLGVSPAQSEDKPLSNEEAYKTFVEAYENITRLIDLITPGEASLPSQIVSSQPQTVARYRPNTAFIMMWMDREHPELVDVREAIRETFESFGIRAIRADDIEHEDAITKRILDEIATSEFLIVVV